MPYEEKYGWNRQSWRVAGFALILCAFALVPGMPLGVRIPLLVFFGGGVVMLALLGLRRITALRVDQDGVTLCASLLFARTTTRLFPWEDVANVIIWRSTYSGRFSRLEFIGVQRRADALPLTGRFAGRRFQSMARLDAPGLPPEVAVTRAATNGWTIDRGKLAATVEYFSPGVRVIDTTTRRILAGPITGPYR